MSPEDYFSTIANTVLLSKDDSSSILPQNEAEFLKLFTHNKYRAAASKYLDEAGWLFGALFVRWARHRKLFNTVEGYLGLGHQDLCVGDQVWICPRSWMPIVLRKLDGQEESYRFLGESYVHGVMYGDLVKHIEPEWIEFILE